MHNLVLICWTIYYWIVLVTSVIDGNTQVLIPGSATAIDVALLDPPCGLGDFYAWDV